MESNHFPGCIKSLSYLVSTTNSNTFYYLGPCGYGPFNKTLTNKFYDININLNDNATSESTLLYGYWEKLNTNSENCTHCECNGCDNIDCNKDVFPPEF